MKVPEIPDSPAAINE